MDIFLFLILGSFFFGGATAIGWFFSRKAIGLNHQRLAKIIAENMVTLKPGNRYIISFPFELTEDELADMVATLDLENSKTHVILVEGAVKVIEFS